MGLYTITTRADGTVLTGFGSTSDIFNADHENHVTHTAAEFLNSREDTLAHMQDTTAPVVSGALSLPASLSDEIERLRYQIALIKQKIAGAATPPYWYTATTDFSDGVQLAPTAARLEQSAAVSIPSSTLTQMTFNTTVYDTASLVSGSTLVAPVNGVYICGATIGMGDGVTQGPTGTFYALLRLTRGTTNYDIAQQTVASTVDEPKAITVEAIKYCLAGDVLKLMVYQNDGTTKQPVAETDARPAMWMSLAGRG